MAKCDCGKPIFNIENENVKDKTIIPESKLNIENENGENNTIKPESKIEAKESEEIAEDADIVIDPKDESDGIVEAESKTLNVFEISEGFDDSDLNVCQLWGNNWRQFTSVLPGLLLLLSLGMHNVFTIHELDHFRVGFPSRIASPLLDVTKKNHEHTDHSSPYGFSYGPGYQPAPSYQYRTDESKDRIFVIIAMWFVGAIVGNMLGAVFVRSMKKRTIYVSFLLGNYSDCSSLNI